MVSPPFVLSPSKDVRGRAFAWVAGIAPRMLISGMRMPLMRTATEAGLVRYENVVFFESRGLSKH